MGKIIIRSFLYSAVGIVLFYASNANAGVGGGYSKYACKTISVDVRFEDKAAKIICTGNANVQVYKLDCGNGTIVGLNGGVNNIEHICKYESSSIEYQARCYASLNNKLSIENSDKTRFSCAQEFTFDPVIEEEREKRKNRIKQSEHFIVIDDDYRKQESNKKRILDENSKIINKMKDVFNETDTDKARLDFLKRKDSVRGLNAIRKYPRVLPKTGTPSSLARNKVENLRKIVELDLPTYVGLLAGNYNKSINFWKQGVVKSDRDRNAYIVIPSNGLVVPLNTIGQNSHYYNEMINGKDVDINEFLKNGVATYAGTEIEGFGQVGNPVIYGHSSYWKKKEGHYKTHFQKIIGLEEGKEIWVFTKKQDGKFKRFRYKIVKSYETHKKDYSTLDAGIGRNLTLMTCTPIGGTTARWVVKAKFIDEEKEELLRKVNGKKVSLKMKKMVDEFMLRLRSLDIELRKKTIIKKFKILLILEKEGKFLKIKGVLNYLKSKLATEYYSI